MKIANIHIRAINDDSLLVLLLVLRAAEAQVLVPDLSGQFSGRLFSHNLFIFAK